MSDESNKPQKNRRATGGKRAASSDRGTNDRKQRALDAAKEAAKPVPTDATRKRQLKKVQSLLSDNLVPEEAIEKLMIHTAKILALREIDVIKILFAEATCEGCCYIDVGTGPNVSIWQNNFKIDTIPRELAKARKIPPCG